jgi:hypothetical protein
VQPADIMRPAVSLFIKDMFKSRNMNSYTRTEDTPTRVRTMREISEEMYGLIAFDYESL